MRNKTGRDPLHRPPPLPPAPAEWILGPVRLCAEQCAWPVLRCTVRVGWEDPGLCPHLCRAACLAGVGSCSPRRLGGSWALPASAPSSAPDAPDSWPDPRVGTSESGAQPPVGRTKIFSEGPKWTWTFANFFLHWTFSAWCPPSASENTTLKHACFDVVSGVASEETRSANFYSRTFSRDLATSTTARDT
jgi:hypothetical protein